MRTSHFRPILLLFATLQIGIQLLEPLHDLFHLAKPRLELAITECKKVKETNVGVVKITTPNTPYATT